MKKAKGFFLTFLVALSLGGIDTLSSIMQDNSVVGHGGGLDKNGCHHDRKTGGYHCH